MTGSAARLARRVATAAQRKLVSGLGGSTRARVIVLLACVLALSSADTATVGASAIQLRHSLGIDNTDIGLLVAVTSLVGAIFSLPFGVLADWARRTSVLGVAIMTWGAAMIWSAAVSSFGQLMVARLFLGAVTAATGPMVASLVGDWFAGSERGRIYSWILTGELVGAGVGFAVTGDVAALSWRAAFVVLALPAFALSVAVFRLPEPQRGGGDVLRSERRPTTDPSREDEPQPDRADEAPELTDAQQVAMERQVQPDRKLMERASPTMKLGAAVRYVLAVRTNVALIVSSACGYYFLAGVQTFGVEFVTGQYRIAQVLADFLLLVVGVGAVIGVLVGGPLGDALLQRGHLNSRVNVAAVAATITVVVFVPALATHNALAALPYIFVAGATLAARNPPIDAARLDIMPSWLWGRAESIRTVVRTGAQALAPLLFGIVSDHLFGGGYQGLRWTFVLMLVPLSASAVLLFYAARHYPTDVATAGAVTQAADDASEPE